MHLLIIDDDQFVRRGVGRLLLRKHSVTTADSGAEALGLIQAGNLYDIILCDFRMAGMNGDVFFMKLRAMDARLCERVLFITGGVSNPNDEAFLSTQRVLRKPFELHQLDAALARVTSELTHVHELSDELID